MKWLLPITLLCACASVPRTRSAVDGEARGKTLGVKVNGKLEGPHGSIQLEVENLVEDAIGIDIDSIRLQPGGKGEGYPPLGREQAFRSDDRITKKLVGRGAATVPPGAAQTLDLEFEGLPDVTPGPRALTLLVPTLYRLGIDGQENLKPIKLPLRVKRRAAGPAARDRDDKGDRDDKSTRDDPRDKDVKFFDPFVEW